MKKPEAPEGTIGQGQEKRSGPGQGKGPEREKGQANDRRQLSRRDLLGLVAAGGAGALVGFVPGSERPGLPPSLHCIVRPAQTEGPYFVDEALNRSDIRSDPTDGSVKPGVPLSLELVVYRVGASSCEPLPGAQVDVWQCDALGEYSGVLDMARRFDTRDRKFLRGYQLTDRQGRVRFTSIYPGWYLGRTPHIHFKIRTRRGAGRAEELTSQLYFDDAVTDEVYRRAPYDTLGPRDRRNEQDRIFMGGGTGAQLLLELAPAGEGYTGTFEVGLLAT